MIKYSLGNMKKGLGLGLGVSDVQDYTERIPCTIPCASANSAPAEGPLAQRLRYTVGQKTMSKTMPNPDADAYWRALTGMGINLLMSKVADTVRLAETVLDLKRSTTRPILPFFAIAAPNGWCTATPAIITNLCSV